MALTLDQLPVGVSARVREIVEATDSLTRLMEMGLVAGSTVRIERTSPFGCPLAIRLKGSSIAIRRQDARQIFLAPLPETA